jgi:hypothetical protein
MRSRPDLLIVVNSSYVRDSDAAKYSAVPLLGEIAALVRVQGVMYEFRAREQCRQLLRRFLDRSLMGALVSIGETSGFEIPGD